jgi:steroid delta-isomerase-like uncharacterized protein
MATGEPPPVCEVCGKPATVHMCSIVDGVSTVGNFCEDCAPSDMRELIAKMRAARCEYCGARGCTDSPDILAMMKADGERRERYLCRLCSEEHGRFVVRELQQVSRTLPQEEQMEALRKVKVAADEHVKQWVAGREARRISLLNQNRNPMNASAPREVALQWFERVWQQRSKEAVHELMAEDGVAHQPDGAIVKGPAEFLGFHERLLTAFPDFSLKILHALGDDKQACLHWEASGTHGGAFGPYAATQKKVTFSGISLVYVADGKITEGWDCWDFGSLMAELSGR